MRRMSIKHGVNPIELLGIHANVYILLAHLRYFAERYELPVEITSIRTCEVDRISTTHLEGRAVDVSVRGWDTKLVEEVVLEMNTIYAHIAAISLSDGVPRSAVYHDAGNGPHFHLQVKP